VQDRQDVLFGDIHDANYRETVRNAWLEVAKECASLGFSRFLDKDVKTLRDDILGKKRS